MLNFTIDTSETELISPTGDAHNCFLYFYLEDGQISYKLTCTEGQETEMAVLLAALHTFECYTAAVDGASQLSNGDLILEKHDVVMETINENIDEDDEFFDQTEFDEHAASPIVAPLNVYNSAFGESFNGDE